ncbi:MAG: Ig-like domain-containing protein [Candidatus Thorarchaeota archaeon]
MTIRVTGSMTLFLVILLVFPVICATSVDSLTLAEMENGDSDFAVSAIDTDRVDWKMDHFENQGFEDWTDEYTPEVDSVTRTSEYYRWYATSPWPVNEGSQSFGMQARATNTIYESIAELQRSSGWVSKSNVVNLTMSFDWYIDELPDSIGNDTLVLSVEFSGPRYLVYHLGSEPTSATNSSSEGNFFIDGVADTWHRFDRNLTEDYFDVFSSYPGSFMLFRLRLISRTIEYSRVFLDDLWLVNGTVIIGGTTENGNFNAATTWDTGPNYSPSDVSRCSDRQEGDWSYNATSTSNGNVSYTYFRSYPDKVASALNPDIFTFQWKMNDFGTGDIFNYAYVSVSTYNSTGFSMSVKYRICGTPPSIFGNGIDINVPGYETTGQWYSFNTSIWEDLSGTFTFSDLLIDRIEFRVATRGAGERISILLDNLTLTMARLNDMGYEQIGDVGDEIYAWSPTSGPFSEMTLTDDAYSGLYAANITVENGNTFGEDQDFCNLPVDGATDLWLDLHWKLQEYSNLAFEEVYMELDFADSNSFGYIFANGSAVNTGNGFEEFILLSEVNSVGTWYSIKRNIFDDYVELFSTEPDTELERIHLAVYSQSGGRIEFLLDDVYLYTDPAPEISNEARDPTAPEGNEVVVVTVDVFDPSLDVVMLHYQVDSGSWMEDEMVHDSGNTFNATIPGQLYDSEVQYYISANDTFGQSTTTGMFSYTTVDTEGPIMAISSPANESICSGGVDISVDASDDASGIQRVELYINGEMVLNDTSAPYSYDWDTTEGENGSYVIIAIGYDVAGLNTTVKHVVTVANPSTSTGTTTSTTDTGTTTPPPPPDMTLILVIAGFLGAVVVILVYMVVIRPRAKGT